MDLELITTVPINNEGYPFILLNFHFAVYFPLKNEFIINPTINKALLSRNQTFFLAAYFSYEIVCISKEKHILYLTLNMVDMAFSPPKRETITINNNSLLKSANTKADQLSLFIPFP